MNQRSWVYDLIKGDEGDYVFVAEVPGPEDKVIAVRLIDGILIPKRFWQDFQRKFHIEGSNEHADINDFRYRNGVLTLRIKIIINF